MDIPAEISSTPRLLLRLLDRRVHENGAAAAEVDGVSGKEAELGKLLDAVAHRLGKGADKRPAPGGAGLVEHDRIDRVVADLEAFDVLPADVEDKSTLGSKKRAALKWAIVSTRPASIEKAFFTRSSP